MSRIGRLPITIPAGVKVQIDSDNTVAVKGPKGEMKQQFNKDMQLKLEDGVLTVARPSDDKNHRALHGLTRALIHNMVMGVTEGFKKSLDIVGVGYRAQVAGRKLVLNVGYSHPVEIDPPQGISFECPTPTKIIVNGIDKQAVGMMAANIREIRQPEPYLGKGIRYENETVRHKEGKAGKK